MDGHKWKAIAQLMTSGRVRSLTVAELLDMRLADLKAMGKARAINTPYYHRRLKDHFGPFRPHRISAEHIHQYWEKRYATPASLREELLELRTAFRMGLKRGLIAEAPYLEIPTRRPPKEAFLTREEAQSLLDAAEPIHLRLYLLIAMTTGARKSAILGLTWPRVDLERGRIDFTDPQSSETNKKRAIVPIHSTVAKTLRLAKRRAKTDCVIEYKGAPIKNIRRAFSSAAAKAGLPWATPHVLKHSVVSWLAEDGYTADQISDMTATHPNTIRRVYRKVNPDYLTELAASLGRGLNFTDIQTHSLEDRVS